MESLSGKKIIKDQSLLRHEDIRRQLRVLPELQAFIPPLLPNEYSQLALNIQQHGCREALLVWETSAGLLEGSPNPTPVYVLVDGHNRYQICQQYGIDFRVNLQPFESMDEVRAFMIDNQLGRRNLTPEQTAYLRGLRYQNEKTGRGKYDRTGKLGESSKAETTAQRLARHYNVNEKTIKRDAEFAQGVDKLAQTLKQQLLAGQLPVAKARIQQLGRSDQAPGSVTNLTEAKDGIIPTRSAKNTETRPAGTTEPVTILKAKLSTLVRQLAQPLETDAELCDQIILTATELKRQLR